MPLVITDELLPADDPALQAPDLDLDGLAVHWASYAARRPMTAEQMRGADRRAQRIGVPGRQLMEQAGAAVAAGARAVLNSVERPSSGRVLVLACEDNLVRGASGVAVQNFNLMYGFDERTALLA